MVMGLTNGTVLALGLSACKREVRVSAAYGRPLMTAEGELTACLTWLVRRAFTLDGVRVWEAMAFAGGRKGVQVRLAGLANECYCRSESFSTLMRTIGLKRSMNSPTLMGHQRVFVSQIDGPQLGVTKVELRQMPGFRESTVSPIE